MGSSKSKWMRMGGGLGGLLLLLSGCGDDESAGAVKVDVPESYSFDSRFGEGSSVSYSGQVMRQVIITRIGDFISGLSASIDDGSFVPGAGDVRAILESYYAFDDATMGTEKLTLDVGAPLAQSDFASISSGKDLKSKFAGNAATPDFRGFGDVTSAEALLLRLFDQLDALAVARAAGEYEIDVATPVYITAEGIDLAEMIEKLLHMGVSYSQAADKYLDEEVDELENGQSVDGDEKELYSPLEHVWDEGFGYFGAARDYGSRSDEDVAAKPAFDSDGDGKIDLKSEMTFSLAGYASKRDLGSKSGTDFSNEIWQGFVTGRAILASAGDTLSESEREALNEQRERVLLAWDRVIAANVVHYINETLVDLGKAESGGFALSDLAAHFSEAKAFALGLQFNPRARLSGAAFDMVQAKIVDKPVLPEAGKAAVEAFAQRLLEARKALQEAYEFADEDVGDDSGMGGW